MKFFDYDEDYEKVPYTWHEGTPRFLFEPDRVPRPFATPGHPRRLNFPEAPPSPSRQPAVKQEQAPAKINSPRHSGRIRQPVFNPDNVYGNRPPVDILGNSDDGNVFGPWGNQSLGSSGKDTGNIVMTTPKAQILQDGGAKLINFLLRAAVSSADAREKIPDVSKVHEWHFRDLMHLPKATQEEWKISCKEELEALHQHNVFKLTNLPKGQKTIGCRWVFNVKSDSCKKARLVAQGFSQVEGIDFNELFSSVMHFESVRLILALSTLEDYYCVGVDVCNAYLYGKLDKEIYMRQPEGFKVRGQENKVICLQRALYGLKQAGLAWWKELNSSMNKLGFKRLVSDAGLFVCTDFKEIIIAIVYVDDAMFFGKNKA
jgi:Reverse transcriptase (RNA-dependent DNA polymerase)